MPDIGSSRIGAGGKMKFASANAVTTSNVNVVDQSTVVSESIVAKRVEELAAEITLLTAKLNAALARIDALEAE